MEREEKFQNVNDVEMKFDVKREWIKVVRRARGQPNYRLRSINTVVEEYAGTSQSLLGHQLTYSTEQCPGFNWRSKIDSIPKRFLYY